MGNISFTELRKFVEEHQGKNRIYAILKNNNDVPTVYEKHTSPVNAMQSFEKVSLLEPNNYILVELIQSQPRK